MKVAVIGSTGQLGTDLVRSFSEGGHQVITFSHAELEVTDQNSVNSNLRGHRVDAVVNCAAYVRVDQAEEEPFIPVMLVISAGDRISLGYFCRIEVNPTSQILNQ